jgi:hypothetical protein
VPFSVRNWRPKLLLLAGVVYGAVVALLAFAPAIIAGWRVTRPGAGHGVISVAIDNTLRLAFKMTSTRTAGWTGSVDLATLGVWVLGPPLLVWAGWLVTRPPRTVEHESAARLLDNDATVVRGLNQPGIDPLGQPLDAHREAETLDR